MKLLVPTVGLRSPFVYPPLHPFGAQIEGDGRAREDRSHSPYVIHANPFDNLSADQSSDAETNTFEGTAHNALKCSKRSVLHRVLCVSDL